MSQLHDFAIATSQLGCSAGIISAAFDLRCRLAHVLSLFQENAADLFPKDVQHRQPLSTQEQDKLQSPDDPHSKGHLLAQRPVAEPETDRESFPRQLSLFAQDFVRFCAALEEYPEFRDLAFNRAVSALNEDLQVSIMLQFDLSLYSLAVYHLTV